MSDWISVVRGLIQVAGGFLRHLVFFYSFRHDGRGLPASFQAGVALTLAACVITIARLFQQGHGPLEVIGLNVINAACVVFIFRARPVLMVAIAMIWGAGDLAMLVSALVVPVKISPFLILWQLAAGIVFLRQQRNTQRELPPRF